MLRRRALPALGLSLLAAPALAQAPWPARQIRLVVPYPPGGASDIAGRLQAQVLQDGLGVPVVVDNRAGAGGTIGTAHVAQSAPDGYTIMMASPSSHLGAPLLFKTPGYEGVDDFTAIATFATGTAMVCVTNSLPVRTIPELIAYARANPGKLNYGSVGAGSTGHMLVAEMAARLGLDMTHVPFRSVPQSVTEIVAGRIELMAAAAGSVLGQVRGGQVRALAVSGDARMAQLPDVPLLTEAGEPGGGIYAWIGLFAPTNMPADRVARLSQEAGRALSNPETGRTLEAAGFEPLGTPPAVLRALIQSEVAHWGPIIRRLNIRPES